MRQKPLFLLVAIGNPSRGDDGLGPALLAAARDVLAKNTPTEFTLECLEAPTGMISLLMEKRSEYLLLLDAACNQGSPGRIEIYDLGKDVIPPLAPQASSHGIDLSYEIALLRRLELLPSQSHLLTIEGASFEHGADLSPSVTAAIPRAIPRIINLIEETSRNLRVITN